MHSSSTRVIADGISVKHPLLHDNLDALRRGLALLASIDDALYTDASISGASIGGHLRHVLDHYRSLLTGLQTGTIDYDARARDPRIETDRARARAATEAIMAALAEIDPQTPIAVRIHAGACAEQTLGAAPSSLERELLFVLLHSVHHYALIAVEMKIRGREVDHGFGVAPATLGYRSRTG